MTNAMPDGLAPDAAVPDRGRSREVLGLGQPLAQGAVTSATLEAFLHDALARGACDAAFSGDQIGVGIGAPPSGNDRHALTSVLRVLHPEIILYVHGGAGGYARAMLPSVKTEAGLQQSLIVAVSNRVACGGLARLMAHHGVRAGVICIDRSVPLPSFEEWIVATRDMLAEEGLVFGGHEMSQLRDLIVLHVGRTHRFDITLGSDYCFCAPRRLILESFPATLVGQVETFKFSYLVNDLQPVASRDVYLRLAAAGIPCRFDVNGGKNYVNVWGSMVKDGRVQPVDFVSHNPGDEPSGVTDPGFLAFTRDTRIQGGHALMYTSHDTFIHESLGYIDHRHIHLQPPWDPMIGRQAVTIGGMTKELHFAFFGRDLRIP